MFGIGMPELIIIFVIALVIIGPKKLPDLARALGKGMAEFRRATEDIKANLGVQDEIKEVQEELADSVSGLMHASDLAEKTQENDTVIESPHKEETQEGTMEKKEDD